MWLQMLLFSGNANLSLAQNIAIALDTMLGLAAISQYADGESKIEILQEVRDQDVFIIQPTSFPANTNILELCLLANALHTKQVRSITAVVPYFGYGRHDGDLNNGPSSAKLIMELFVTARINRLLTLDLHSERLQETSGLALKNLSAMPLFVGAPQIKQLQDPVIISPDMGGIKRARKFAKLLDNAPVAIIDKQRSQHNKAVPTTIIGNVVNRNCIIVDDIIDTGNTLYAAAAALKAQGAQQVYACCTHAVLSNNALALLEHSACDKIFVTNSIFLERILSAKSKINVVSAADLLAAAILNKC
jgi:ribose-phosphate pyrophosphokinase